MIRPYRPDDLEACTGVVRQVWQFDERLPRPLAGYAARVYTEGTLAGSNVAWIAEVEGSVAGLLFGRIGRAPVFRTTYSGAVGQVTAVGQLLLLPSTPPREKSRWLLATARHERLVTSLKPTKEELTLFVVDPGVQGRGIGRMLVESFLERCQLDGVERIVVETDTDSNFGFYDHLGFTRIHEFHSPLNALLTGGSGESFIYEMEIPPEGS